MSIRHISLRKAHPKELPVILDLFVQSITNNCRGDYDEAQIAVWISSAEDKDRWLEKISSQYFLVAMKQSAIVGIGSLKDGYYVDVMYVHPKYLKRGIARMLYQELKAESLRQGYPKLSSDVSYTARPFFERQGFKVIRKNHILKKDVEIINFHMREA